MKITDFKSYQEYANYLTNNYGRTSKGNREIEEMGFLKLKSHNCNGEPWSSFTKIEFVSILFMEYVVDNQQILEYQHQKDLNHAELLYYFYIDYPLLKTT